MTSIGNSEVSTTKYSYDYTGLNTAVTEDTSGTGSYIYDELGRITKATRGKSGAAVTTHVQYDAIGQITKYQTANSSGVVAEHVYEYDDNGNRIRDKKLDGSYVVYKYDQVNQLIAEEYFSAQAFPPVASATPIARRVIAWPKK